MTGPASSPSLVSEPLLSSHEAAGQRKSVQFSGCPTATTLMLLASLATGASAARAAAAVTQPPFVLSECLALLDDDPSDVDDYVSSHMVAGNERAIGHCRAVAEVMTGDALAGAEQLDQLAHEAARHEAGADDDSTEERANVAADAARAWFAAAMPGKAADAAGYGLTLTPESIALRLLKDRALLQLDQPQTVIRDLTPLADNPLLAAETHRLKAMAEVQTDAITQAQTDIEQSLTLEPDDTTSLLERGIIRQRLNNPEGARADWEKVISLEPDSHEADLARQDLTVLASDPDALPPSTVTLHASAAAPVPDAH
ncbi:tetratricopeptide repeat protein [Acetobacter sicerae]|nr:tetratricopeptide repeat protein [Acetobacter sicerae]